MAANQDSPVFSYQTRVAVTAEQDHLLREYARLFGHVERTLFADLQRGKDAGQLKSEYLARFSITARQFNALRIQLLGKISAIRELIPPRIENLKTKIRKAKRVVRKLAKCLPGSKQLHYRPEALDGTGAAFGAIEKGSKDWPGTLVLRLEATLPCPVSSGGEWLPVSPRIETSMDRGPVEAVLHHRVEG